MEKLGGWEDAVHQLAASDCEPLTLPELLEHADDDGLARWEVLSLGYPDVSRGDDALLTELAEGLYGGAARGFGRDNVLGVIPAEGILLAMNALLEHGDHVVVMAPAYASLRSVAEAALGCDISPWPVEWQADGRPTFCLERLRGLITPRTTVLVINCPHNPTGWHPMVEEWSEIIAICEQHGIWLFSDEMYRHLEQANGERATLPSAAESYSRGVTLSGLSKAYGLAGLRLGWLASQDAAVIERCYELKDYTSICAGTPNECLGLIALRAREALWARCNDIVATNLILMDQFAQGREDQIEWRRPLAGPVALPRLVNGAAATTL